ncbi:MAG: hypothetical protein COB35_07780 [Gammaproteobacteria bacterium]|nr:MAG: hypothetical protein COB35_07780 [Gammaproteobacteria bacterium]
MDLFFLKKMLGFLLMPLSLILILLIIAIIFHRKKPSLSFKCMISATALLIVTSMPPLADYLIKPLETQYPQFTAKSTTKPIDYIVVLGCSHTNDNRVPFTSQLRACSMQRLVEMLRIYQLHPEATIITSGSAFGQVLSNAQTMKLAAISLGIPAQKILTENFPKDTEEEAQLIAPRVKDSNVVLITNADHMLRAMRFFKQYGVDAIPAPAGYWAYSKTAHKNWGYYTPSINKLGKTTTVWYEALGLSWQWLKKIFN